MKTLVRCTAMAGFAIGVALAASAPATESPPYPSKPIRLIAPSTPGSPVDVLARAISEPLAAALGQPVVVDNRPGATGTIGLAAVAKAQPDGYTLGVIAMPYVVAPSLLPQVSYDTARDLAPVRQTNWSSNILVVRREARFTSLAELVAAAKARPGQLTYGSGGNGTPSHLLGELFRVRAGIEIRHVPFKGASPAATAVAGDQVDMAFGPVTAVAGPVKSGRLRALAVPSPARVAALPEVPTMLELGVNGVEMRDWHGIVAPAGTPKSSIGRIASEVTRILAQADVRERLVALGLEPEADSGPDAFGGLIQSELARWAKFVREAGIRAD